MRRSGRSDDRPRIALITGEPGSGKSTLGAKLSLALEFPSSPETMCEVACSSQPEPGPHGREAARPPHEAGETFLRMVESTVGLGVSCIVEYIVRQGRPGDLQRMAAAADCRVLRTWCRDTPQRLARRDTSARLLNQRPVLDALGYSSIDEHTSDALARMRSVTDEMQTDFELPVLNVNTDAGYEPGLDVVIDFLTD